MLSKAAPADKADPEPSSSFMYSCNKGLVRLLCCKSTSSTQLHVCPFCWTCLLTVNVVRIELKCMTHRTIQLLIQPPLQHAKELHKIAAIYCRDMHMLLQGSSSRSHHTCATCRDVHTACTRQATGLVLMCSARERFSCVEETNGHVCSRLRSPGLPWTCQSLTGCLAQVRL